MPGDVQLGTSSAEPFSIATLPWKWKAAFNPKRKKGCIAVPLGLQNWVDFHGWSAYPPNVPHK